MKNPGKSNTSQHAPPRDESKVICGCGLSRTFPFCDGTQMIARTHLRGKLVSCGAARQPDPSNAELQAS